MSTAFGDTAREIAQAILDMTGNALLSNDFEAFAPYFQLPHLIEAAEQRRMLTTTADLRMAFDKVVEDIRLKQVTDLIRVCEVAEFRSATRLVHTHASHMMSGNLRATEPFHSYSVLDLVGGRWLVSSSQYAVDSKTAVGRAMQCDTTQNLDQAGQL